MKIRNFKIVFLFFIAIFTIYVVWFIFGPLKYMYAASYQIPIALQNIGESLKDNDYNSANIYIKQTQDNIAIIKKNLNYIKFIKKVPILGEKYVKINSSLENAWSICSDSSKIIDSLAKSKNITVNDLLLNLNKHPQKVQNLIQNFSSLMDNKEVLVKIFKVNDHKSIDSINLISKLLKILKPLNNHLFEILGYKSEQKYLLLFQNNTELRPTGGFIGSYGILRVSNGKIIDLFIDDIYHLDSKVIGKLNNEVPTPLKKYLKMEEWYMRDCNWDPDFPSTAKKCLDLYKIESENSDKINGIITLTPDVVGQIFEIIKAQEISGILFAKNNFTATLQKAVELYYQERGVSHWQRKDIISDLANSILKEFKHANTKDYQKLVDILIKNLETKNILFYSQNNDLEKILSKLNWSGEILDKKNDYLMIVDSNLASFKSDQYINRNIYYSLEEDKDNNLIVTLTLKYKHNGNFSWNSTRYRTYTRVLVPRGSKLLKVIGAMDNDRSSKRGKIDIYQKYNKEIFGAFISIEPQKENSLIFKYKLPERFKNEIRKKQHIIYLQKQAGVRNVQCNLKLKFKNQIKNLEIKLNGIKKNNPSDSGIKFKLDKDYSIEINWK